MTALLLAAVPAAFGCPVDEIPYRESDPSTAVAKLRPWLDDSHVDVREASIMALASVEGEEANRALADLNVAASISQPNEEGKIDWQRLDPYNLGLRALGDWLGRCVARDSWKRVAEYP